jgi:hypothetical protein
MNPYANTSKDDKANAINALADELQAYLDALDDK